MSELAFRTCPLCEATCGLEIEVRDGGEIGRIRGDRDDVFSHGFICPKGSTLKPLHEDPDRLRTPMLRGEDGELHPTTWEEAFAEVERRLLPIIEEHGKDAVAIYFGNPSVHNMGAVLFNAGVARSLRTTNVYSASTVDQRPKEISAALMFGTGISFAVPDLDRTSYLLMLGANPFESNGSLATAPDWPGRLRGIVARGGRVVCVDPKRTKTAEEASEHIPIRPGSDALLLMAMVHVLFDEGLVDLGRLEEFVNNSDIEEVKATALDFTPEAVAAVTAIDAETIRRLTRELAGAETAAVYGRIGTCTQEFGTLASWLVDVLNILTGNLDRPGGAMFAKPAAGGPTTTGTPGKGRQFRLARRHSRVRGLPESLGEFPVVCLAEEIDTPGEGQVKAFISIAGNPALSGPNSDRLQRAFDSLDFMVSVDPYINETTRHADVILPSPSTLTKSHYDLAFYQFAVRNVANYSPPVLPPEAGAMEEWKILAKLTLIIQGMGADADPSIVDEVMFSTLAKKAGMDPDEAMSMLAPRVGPDRLLDLMLRTGPYGLTLDQLIENPHGIDLGALEPRLPEVLRTATGAIEMAPEPIMDDVPRLKAALERKLNGGFVLIGRRHIKSNNSWMHNVPVLMKGKARCTLQIHPDDASHLGVDGSAKVSSRTGSVVVPVEITDTMMRGVVSLPHGWGHDLNGVQMDVARNNAGVNSNILADDELFDVLSGNAVLNGIPVDIAPG